MSDDADVVETIVRADVLQQLLDQVGALARETVLQIGRDGISTGVVDPANVAMCEVELPSEAFESTPTGKFAAGVNINKMDDYLGRASGDDLVSLAFNTETRKLVLKHSSRRYTVALINPDDMRDSADLPDIDNTAKWTLPAGEFTNAVKDAETVTGSGGTNGAPVHLNADSDSGELVVFAEGDTDDITVTFGPDDYSGPAEFDEDTETMYSLGYLVGDNGFLKPIPKGADVTAEYASEYPIELNYDFPDVEGANATLFLAPRLPRQ